MQVQHPWLARDVAHATQQFGARLEHHMPVWRHVDHAVVGGHQEAGANLRSRFGQHWEHGCHGRVRGLKRRRPLVGSPAVLMRSLIKFWQVDIGDASPRLIGEQLNQRRGPIGRAPALEIAGAAKHCVGEPRIAVLRGADDHGVEATATRLLKQGGHRLPDLWLHAQIPPAQLIDDPVVRRIHRRVANDAVLPRPDAGRQRRERRRGRRGHAGGDDVGFGGHGGCEGARMAGALAQRVGAEPVDEHHHRPVDGGQLETIRHAERRVEGTSQDIGKARTPRARRR